MPWARLVLVIAFVLLLVASLYYGGLLSLSVAFFVNQILNNAPMTLQPSMPYAPVGIRGDAHRLRARGVRLLRVARRSAALRTGSATGLTAVANILSCPSCAAVVVPQESGGVCPQCRTPLPGTWRRQRRRVGR